MDDRSTLDLAYANAMRQLVKQYPDDLDAATTEIINTLEFVVGT